MTQPDNALAQHQGEPNTITGEHIREVCSSPQQVETVMIQAPMSTENQWSRGICGSCGACGHNECFGKCLDCVDDLECEACAKVCCVCMFIAYFCCGCCAAVHDVSGYVGEFSSLWCCCGYPFAAFLRQSLRKKHNIPGTCAKDCGICFFCFPCMLCQMVAEIKYGQHKDTGLDDISHNLHEISYTNRMD